MTFPPLVYFPYRNWFHSASASENLDTAVSPCLPGSFHVAALKRSAADTSIFRVLLNGERLTVNRFPLLLIIINNASLPIYLSHAPANHFHWSAQPPLLHTTHPPSFTHTHTHTSKTHTACTQIRPTHTNPHFSYTNTFFNRSFPLPPSSLHHHSLPFSFFPSPSHHLSHPFIFHHSPSQPFVSNPIWLLQQDLHHVVQEDNTLSYKRRGSPWTTAIPEMLTRKKKIILFEMYSEYFVDWWLSAHS